MSMKAVGSKLQYCDAIPASKAPKRGKAVSANAGGLAICIAADKNGYLYALSDKAPPTGQPLSQGSVEGTTICDPTFGSRFDLKTGACVEWLPGGFGAILRNVFEPQGVYTYPVKSQGGKIQVQVNVNARAEYEQGYWKGILDAQGKSDGSYY